MSVVFELLIPLTTLSIIHFELLLKFLQISIVLYISILLESEIRIISKLNTTFIYTKIKRYVKNNSTVHSFSQ